MALTLACPRMPSFRDCRRATLLTGNLLESKHYPTSDVCVQSRATFRAGANKRELCQTDVRMYKRRMYEKDSADSRDTGNLDRWLGSIGRPPGDSGARHVSHVQPGTRCHQHAS